MKTGKHPIYRGAILLTATGLICRLIGFYYKIFLSRVIGPKELGLYQLAMPLLSMGIAFSCSGIHTALSKFVASHSSPKDASAAKRYLAVGLVISLFLCMIFCIPCYLFIDSIALHLFGEPAVTLLLQILLLCIPLECIHGCINGYYYGLQRAGIPAAGQCLEQLIRVGSVFGIYYIMQQSGLPFCKEHAMLGLLLGEAGATLYYFTVLSLSSSGKNAIRKARQLTHRPKFSVHTQLSIGKQLLSMAYPITANRLLMTGLNSLENILIPQKLVLFGLNNTQALSVYGIYSGMAIPMIFFPMVIANSIAVMLLPSISKAQEEGRYAYITRAVNLSFFLCMLFGFLCSLMFFFLGPFLGEQIFENEVAGIYIRTLSWLCPFLFLGTTMNSILNGLGKTKDTFCFSMTGALLRLGFVWFGIPLLGFRGFLLGSLCSQAITSILAYLRLLHFIQSSPKC